MSDLADLKFKRGKQKAALTRIKKFIDSLDTEIVSSITYFEVKARLDKLYKINECFEEIQDQIDVLVESEKQEEEEEYKSDFEAVFYNLCAEMESILQRFSDSTSKSSNDGGNNATGLISAEKKRVKLPTIQLPTFDGEYKNWITFRDMFRSLIHEQSNLSKIEKLHYLKASLKGEASGLIDSLQICEDNYEVAFNTLVDRYDNKKLLVHHHLKLMFETPVIAKESLIDLRKLVDDIKGNINILANLGIDTNSWDSWVLYLISTKLDPATRREWEKYASSKEFPLLKDFYDFMNQRCQLLEKLKSERSSAEQKPTSKLNVRTVSSNFKAHPVKNFLSSNVQKCCPHCKEDHQLFNCPKFLELPIKSRYQIVKQLKACLNCLKSSHVSKVCISGGCKKCGKKHNSLLHFDSRNGSEQIHSVNSQEASPDARTQFPLISASSMNNGQVLLSTALVKTMDKHKQNVIARVLLDSGSQSNFITKEFFSKLGVSSRKTNQPVTGICQQNCNLSDIVDLEIHSMINKYSFYASFLVIDNITDKLPQSEINVQSLQIPDNIILADPGFATPSKIDMLLGASVFWNLLSVGQIKLNGRQPIMQKTRLGWVISGSIPKRQEKGKNDTTCNFLSLNEQLEKFWSLEDIATNSLSKYESLFENHFKKTLVIKDNGHFEVGLPVKQNVTHLGDSFYNAYHRFLQLEKRLNKSDHMKQLYVEFMTEYERLGHMSLVTEKDKSESDLVYYLPHHGVLKEANLTTKLRVVFDGSAKSDTGISLNDVLMSGPVIQDDLFSILLRFRKHSIVIASDIEKMYRQVYISPKDRDLQRILWRRSSEDSIQKYRLNTVTYGTTSGSFLAIRCLHEVANRIEYEHPNISQIIREDFYVDDLLTGGETVEEVLKLQELLTINLQKFGFPLRKWNSNHPLVVQEIIKNSNNELKHVVIEDAITKTLGLHWDAANDCLHYLIYKKQNTVATKRSILASIAQIFDPLGLIGPVVTLFKILMQDIWRSQIQWDESLPQNIFTKWNLYQSNWNYINKIVVPRQIVCSGAVDAQLHGFCDASQSAYGACIYLVSKNNLGNRWIRLLCSKSRVAPLKSITLPRLELCAALLLSKLTDKVVKGLKLNLSKQYLWTDSQITLAWILKEPQQWKDFVANRVSEIQRLTKNCVWGHVSGKENPADIISRGMDAKDLLSSELWWNGPSWLSLPERQWPISNSVIDTQEIPEQKERLIAFVAANKNDLFEKYSTFRRLQRVVAYIQRFLRNCKKNKPRRQGPLQSEELQEALTSIIKRVQNEEYNEEIKHLKSGKAIPSKSKLLALNPIVDDQDILRVGGRLQQSNLNFEERHPIIIPGSHKIAELLIKHEHHKQLHSGAQAILYSLRQKFWIIGGLTLIKRTLRKCITCFRTKPRFYKHQMGELPRDRVSTSSPFEICGVDYAGPVNIKASTLKNSKILKAYISIFICFSTKAVHIELVSDLSAEAFLNTLKRFIARRGKPKKIYSDNGRNFVGAYKTIKHIENALKVKEYLAEETIKWHFIPPRSPHFGGLWEAAVKSAKSHLKRVIGETVLTFEELYTVLVQIEACLNSRPISPISDDPNDLIPLTPSHFLLTKQITLLPEDNVLHLPQNRLKRYQHLMAMVQHFWSRWSKEYLNNLQHRTKWKSTANPPKEGDLVLLADEQVPTLHWRLGRIVKLHPGADGVPRVAELKTATGNTTRAIRKLCPLPV